MRVFICLLILMCNALARDDGRWANSPDRDWFQAQLVPRGERKGESCCNSADGSSAEEDIRGGEYWARFQTCDSSKQCVQVEWMRVPTDAVIDEPNKRGVPTVWWYYDDDSGVVHIRCYAPGSKA